MWTGLARRVGAARASTCFARTIVSDAQTLTSTALRGQKRSGTPASARVLWMGFKRFLRGLGELFFVMLDQMSKLFTLIPLGKKKLTLALMPLNLLTLYYLAVELSRDTVMGSVKNGAIHVSFSHIAARISCDFDD